MDTENTGADEVTPDLDPVEPLPLSNDEYEACENVLRVNADAGLIDILVKLSDQTQDDLTRLAYTDVAKFERLERVIKSHITDLDDGSDKRAVKFNLSTYRRAAKQVKDRIAVARAKRKELRARNLRIVGGIDMDGLRDYADGTPLSTQAKAESESPFMRSLALLEMQRKGRIWWDDFGGVVYTDWSGRQDDTVMEPHKIDDAFFLRVHEWLQYNDSVLAKKLSFTSSEKAILAFADLDHRNEPRDWMASLKWDGEPRLEKLMSAAYGIEQDDYAAAAGRCWFISMVARCFKPGAKVDTMPVFYGPQGTYKSTSLGVIGGKWYASISASAAHGTDFQMALRGVLVAEIAELDAINSRKVDNSRVKMLLSTEVDHYRAPYGRVVMDWPRTAVVAGTTNDQGWHRDASGGRRFWPINCKGLIDIEWLKLNRDQLFAEAVHRYKNGEGWHDVPKDRQDELVAEHFTADPWLELIENALAGWSYWDGGFNGVKAVAGDPKGQSFEDVWGTLITTNRLTTVALQLPTSTLTWYSTRRLGEVLRTLGWKMHAASVKIGAEWKKIKCWVPDRSERPNDQLEMNLPNKSTE